MVINIMNTSFAMEMFDIEHLLFGCEQPLGIGYLVNTLYICMNNDAYMHT